MREYCILTVWCPTPFWLKAHSGYEQEIYSRMMQQREHERLKTTRLRITGLSHVQGLRRPFEGPYKALERALDGPLKDLRRPFKEPYSDDIIL